MVPRPLILMYALIDRRFEKHRSTIIHTYIDRPYLLKKSDEFVLITSTDLWLWMFFLKANNIGQSLIFFAIRFWWWCLWWCLIETDCCS